MALEAIGSLLGSEAAIGGVEGLGAEAQVAPTAKPSGEGFGKMLGTQLESLNGVQMEADAQAKALATGQAQDVTEVVVAAERAQLSLQLASQMRNKFVDAYHELMRTQI